MKYSYLFLAFILYSCFNNTDKPPSKLSLNLGTSTDGIHLSNIDSVKYKDKIGFSGYFIKDSCYWHFDKSIPILKENELTSDTIVLESIDFDGMELRYLDLTDTIKNVPVLSRDISLIDNIHFEKDTTTTYFSFTLNSSWTHYRKMSKNKWIENSNNLFNEIKTKLILQSQSSQHNAPPTTNN